MLHEHFENPEHVAHIFGVSGNTAENWWTGAVAPQSWAVGWALRLLPEAALRAMVRP